ncbi:MAG: 16S rRNA pseudouridine(516) synthase, partial [Clostridia bacterium]|nr:16S rRNA pseudouridine(516) synthase [Clostridia bacterium]
MERLDKFIASQTGLSRTQAHEKIRAGAVCVNGKVERTKDRKVDPEKDDVTLSGQSVVYRKYIY